MSLVTSSLLALTACATSKVPTEAPEAPAPRGSVVLVTRCSRGGEPLRSLWNPSGQARSCRLEELEPLLVEPLREVIVREPPDLVLGPSPELVCSDAADTTAADVAAAIARLADPDPGVRSAAAHALAALGPRARSAAPALAERLQRETEAYPFSGAVWALVDLVGPDAAPHLLDALAVRGDAELRRPLADAITALGAAAAPALVARLADARVASALSISDVLPVDLDAARTLLVARYASGDNGLRREAVSALKDYLKARPDDADIAALALAALATSPDGDHRYRAVDAVARLRTPEAVAALVHALHDPDRTVVFNAAEALGSLGLADKRLVSAEVADAVAALLPTSDRTLSWNACMALGRLGHDTERVRAALSAAEASGDVKIAIIVAAARAQLAGRLEDDATLRAGLVSSEARVMGLTLARVQELGPVAAPLIEDVAALLSASSSSSAFDATLATRVVEVLLAIGPAAHPALEPVAAGRRRVDPWSWLAVVDAVGEEAAAPFGDALTTDTCSDAYPLDERLDAAITRMRLARARPEDEGTLLDALAGRDGETLARRLTPFVSKLDLDAHTRDAIAWLATHHASHWARVALRELARGAHPRGARAGSAPR